MHAARLLCPKGAVSTKPTPLHQAPFSQTCTHSTAPHTSEAPHSRRLPEHSRHRAHACTLRAAPRRDAAVATGVLDGVDAIFGLHNWPALPHGVVASRAGTIMAGTAEFRITMHGRGGHAAMPQGNIDPVPPLAALVAALQVRAAPCMERMLARACAAGTPPPARRFLLRPRRPPRLAGGSIQRRHPPPPARRAKRATPPVPCRRSCPGRPPRCTPSLSR